MTFKVKALSGIIAAALTLSLAACGGQRGGTATGGSTETSKTEPELNRSPQKDTKSNQTPLTVKLGVVGSIYEELWKPARQKLENEGIRLEIVQFSDYVTPNNALDSGEIDLNAFQHQIYLNNEVKTKNYKIENIGNTFIIPLNLYSKKLKSLGELKDGDSVGIPDDVTNGGRALKVLEATGLIKLKQEAGFNPTVNDIESYNTKIKIEELKANVLPSSLPDLAAAIINGNYALDFGLKNEDTIYKDTVLDQAAYWNLIAARTADLADPAKKDAFRKVVEAFQTEDTQRVFDETFDSAFIAVGWDKDLLLD